MSKEMKKDPAIKLQLASDYASIANYWKFYDGETKQLLKYDVYGQKQKQEAEFAKWSATKTEYQNIFNELNKAYTAWKPYAMHRVYMNEGIFGSPLLAFAATLQPLENALVKPGTSTADIKKLADAASKVKAKFYAKRKQNI